MPHAHARPAVIAVRLRSAAFGALLTLAAIGLFALAQHVLRPANAALPAVVEGQPLPSLAPMLERVTPAVVNIHSKTVVRVRNPMAEDPFFRHFFGLPMVPQERVQQSLGSGVIVNAREGLVLTNNHVIEGADDISVTLADGRTVTAEFVGSDPDTDVGVLRIPAEDLAELPLASGEALRVGDFVVAVGNPFGLGQTVTSGIVSALGRSGLQGLAYQNFIQTDASINPGNSGGALVNLRGELVGINTAIFTPSGGNVGIGFAIPAELANEIMRQLLDTGRVQRGSLGIETQAITPQLAAMLDVAGARGAVVTRVRPGSPAAEAGLQPGDVITAIAQQPVDSPQTLNNKEGLLPVGEPITLEYLREGRSQRIELRLKPQLSQLLGSALDPRLDGAEFTALPQRSRQQGVSGIRVERVADGSRAARSGLAAGDLVTGVNRFRIDSLDTFGEVIEMRPQQLALSVVRGRRSGVVVME
ncbi:MAG: Do family serine endopeptidase [Lysobacterales bacterium]|jgi:serine protease DegQ